MLLSCNCCYYAQTRDCDLCSWRSCKEYGMADQINFGKSHPVKYNQLLSSQYYCKSFDGSGSTFLPISFQIQVTDKTRITKKKKGNKTGHISHHFLYSTLNYLASHPSFISSAASEILISLVVGLLKQAGQFFHILPSLRLPYARSSE